MTLLFRQKLSDDKLRRNYFVDNSRTISYDVIISPITLGVQVMTLLFRR